MMEKSNMEQITDSLDCVNELSQEFGRILIKLNTMMNEGKLKKDTKLQDKLRDNIYKALHKLAKDNL